MNNLEKAGQKITLTLLAGQSLFSASIIITFTVGAIIVVELAGGNPQWTGVPSTLVVIGSAMIAYPIGRLMDRVGRRPGLTIGYLLGIISALVAGLAVVNQSLIIFLLGVFGLGLTKGIIDLGRYAAGEASPARRRGQAISWVVLGGTAGSILGPSLIEATGNWAEQLGLPLLSGAWFAAALFFGVGMIITYIFLRPDPQAIGQQWAALESATISQAQRVARPYTEVIRNPHIQLATGTLIFAQLTMVVVMVVTPIHMHGHQHNLSSISVVIMAHTLGMFGLSFVTGWLADRIGRFKMIIAGGLVLSLACFMAPFSNSVAWLSVALFLLGLGWNFCFVAGSTLLSDLLRSAERGRVQGLTDTMVNVASGVGNLVSGLAFATVGFSATSWFTISLGLIPIILVIFLRVSPREVSMEGATPGK